MVPKLLLVHQQAVFCSLIPRETVGNTPFESHCQTCPENSYDRKRTSIIIGEMIRAARDELEPTREEVAELAELS